MKVFYKLVLWPDGTKRGDCVSYDLCCSIMITQWDEGNVQLGGTNDRIQANHPIGKYGWMQVCLDFRTNGYYGDIDHDYSPIKFCPWCGSAIEVIEKERVKMVEHKTTMTEPAKTVVLTNYTEEKISLESDNEFN